MFFRTMHSHLFLLQITAGPVIMLEYSVHDVEAIQNILKKADHREMLHISDSIEDGAREIDCLNNLTEMQMSV